MTRPEISVIIPVHNRAAMVEVCVRSVLAAGGPPLEVVVVDDGSTDRPEERIGGLGGVRLVRRERRGGPGAARNSGVGASRGARLLFLDSDCRVEGRDWAEQHLAAAVASPVSVLSGGVRGIHRTYGGAVDGYLNWFMFSGGARRVVRSWHLPMTNIVMGRETFDRVGPFAEDLPCLEDVDWCYRARTAGIPLEIFPGASVLHHDREGLGGAFDHQRQFGRAQRALRRRHPRSPRAWLFPKSFASSLVMALPLAVLMTLYVTARALPRDPGVLWHLPGIAWGHLGHVLGVAESFTS